MTSATKNSDTKTIPEPRRLEALPDDLRFEITPADRQYLTEAGRKALLESGGNVLVVGRVKKIEAELRDEDPAKTLTQK